MLIFNKFQALVSISLPLLCQTTYTNFSGLNFNATFGNSPAPFKIDVSPAFIDYLNLKVSLTRYVTDINVPDFSEGPTQHNVSTVHDYWLNKYDWFSVQDQINRNFSQYTTTVTTGPLSNYSYPVPLHFVHHRSPRADAVPLLFSHGWPGNFLEVSHIIHGLTNPPNASLPAFHVVAPSIPGFAFSPTPTHPGFGNRQAAHAYNSLMQQLNYTRYVVQGGDFGGIILRYIAASYPENVISALANFYIVPPNATDRERYQLGETDAEENLSIEEFDFYLNKFQGYRIIQSNRPLTLAIGMTDSPVGNAMWIYDLMQQAVDFHVWTPEEIITWTMMYQIQGPYGGFRWYLEAENEGTWVNLTWGTNNFDYIHQPIAINQFPKDIWSTPLSWAQRTSNVVRRFVHDRGGHFAAYEAPDLLLGDIREWFGGLGLGVSARR